MTSPGKGSAWLTCLAPDAKSLQARATNPGHPGPKKIHQRHQTTYSKQVSGHKNILGRKTATTDYTDEHGESILSSAPCIPCNPRLKCLCGWWRVWREAEPRTA